MKDSSASWVFYRRLLRDAVKPKERPELLDIHREGKQLVGSAHFGVSGYAHNGQALINMANAELAKEEALLNQIFGVGIKFDFQQPGAIKELIDTINACLNLKEVYERNKQIIIADNGGQKGVFSYFGTYILQGFDSRRINIQKKVINRFLNHETFFDAVKTVLDEEFNTYIIPKAIDNMLNAQVERGVDEQYANAYAEVLRAIATMPNNPLVIGLKQAWGINNLINELSIKISSASSIQDINQMFHKYQNQTILNKNNKKQTVRTNGELRQLISRNSNYNNQASGLSLEALEDQIFAMVANGIPNFTLQNDNFKIEGSVQANSLKGVGYKKMRTDGAVIFNMDGAPIEQMLNNENKNDRKTAINLFNKIGEHVEKVRDGFIVYSNAKNYTLNDNFKTRGGYSAGEAISLEQLEGALGNFINNVDDLITVLLNAGYGTIAEGNTGEASRILAQAIAFALFDDWNYIGNTSGGGMSIHVMNLNGVLIPLSTFLFSLGQAIEDIEGNPSSFVTVNIQLARYDTGHDAVYGLPYWHDAVSFGKSNTMISYHFMKNITSFLKF